MQDAQGRKAERVLGLREQQTVLALDARIEELAEERSEVPFWRKALNCFWGEGEGSITRPPLIGSGRYPMRSS